MHALKHLQLLSVVAAYLVIYLVQPHRQTMQPAKPRAQRTSPWKSPSGSSVP